MPVATDSDWEWLGAAALSRQFVEVDELYRRHLLTPAGLQKVLNWHVRIATTAVGKGEGLREVVSAQQVLLRMMLLGLAVFQVGPEAVANAMAGARPN